MAIAIKSLASGKIDWTSAANIYPPATNSFTTRSATVKSVRFVNRSTSNPITLTLYSRKDGESDRPITVVVVPVGSLLIIDEKLMLEAGYALRAKVSFSSGLDYVISGLERD